MKKLKYIQKGACIGAAVLMLGACGQSDKPDAVSTEAVVETTAEGDLSQGTETSAEEETTTEALETEDSKEDAPEKETLEEENSETEDAKEDASKEENAEDKEGDSSENKDNKEDESADASEESGEETAKAEETPAPVQGNAKSVQDIYTEITQAVSLNSPMLVPNDFIMNYYGIDVSTLDEYVFSMSEAAISAETVVILKAKDAAATDALRASLQTVIDQKRSEMENYLPDQFQIVDRSSVQVKGNYVYLVISEQADTISQIIQADLP